MAYGSYYLRYLLDHYNGNELLAVAEEESAGERLAFYRVTVARQDGTCVGLMHATVYRTKEKHHLTPTHEH